MNQELYTFSEVLISYKPMVKPSKRPKVTSSHEAYKIVLQAYDENTIDYIESFKTMFIDRKGGVIGIHDVATGGCASVYVDPKVVFTAALKANAASIILSHNHPSRSLRPSQSDENITRKLFRIGLDLELPINDHLIITPDGYFSFADEGLLFI